MLLPEPRGSSSSALIEALRTDDVAAIADVPRPSPQDVLGDDDLQLSLWICFELHYRGFLEVTDHWEWEPALIALRRDLERVFLDGLRDEVGEIIVDPGRVSDQLRWMVSQDDGPSLSRFMQGEASVTQFSEFIRHRSVYQLKEADPHTWVIPRLEGRAKAALVEVQVDEYGDGDPAQMHSELYRTLLREVGLDDTYGAYVDEAPGITLALSNVMSLFGLHRELRGALVGHLAAYEMTSSGPCRRYARGLRRLGGSDAACAFYDVHVTADALHEQVAAHDLCDGLADSEPALVPDILFGAAACLLIDVRFAEHVLGRWESGLTSLVPVRTHLADAS